MANHTHEFVQYERRGFEVCIECRARQPIPKTKQRSVKLRAEDITPEEFAAFRCSISLIRDNMGEED